MADSTDGLEPPRKRARGEAVEAVVDTQTNASAVLTSLATPITPPQRKARLSNEARKPSPQPLGPTSRTSASLLPSPFQLTTIQDLPTDLNTDTVRLKDLLGDPLIAECWEFNYLHDLDFLMEAFDPDVRGIVKVRVVHGFWKQEDGARLKVYNIFLNSDIAPDFSYMSPNFKYCKREVNASRDLQGPSSRS